MKRFAFLAAAATLLGAAAGLAQQLEPRAYSPSPVGLNFIVLPYVYQTGSVVTDPALPVQNIDARINTVAPFYSHTFGFFGRSASAALALPYIWGTVSGDVFEERRSVTRSGQGDMVVRLATNLLGGPAMTREEFARVRPGTTLGASLVVSMPTGQYDGAKLINLGTNRWAFRPEIGLSHPVGRWAFELYTGAWFFTPNDDFFGGVRRTQEPIVALQGHVSYTFLPGLWVALNATWYSGGRTSLNGTLNQDRQNNARVGVTAAAPLSRAHSLKLLWARGATTRIGQNFTTFSVAYQYRWF